MYEITNELPTFSAPFLYNILAILYKGVVL